MSVTFNIAGQGFKYECDEYCGSCEQCQEAASHSRENEMNVSNSNACALLEALGFSVPEDLCGAIPARDLILRAKAALSRPEDAEVPSYQEGNFIDCGRRAGYVHGRVSQLLALAERAGDLGRITYG